MSSLATPVRPQGPRRAPGRTTREPGAHAGRSPVARPTGATRRRRNAALGLVLATVLVLTVAAGWAGAQAQLADEVAGHVLLEPGQTLWDVAVDTAPAGVDPRRQLADLRELNAIDGSHVDAWSVILVPAR